jgi:hypothetical protein
MKARKKPIETMTIEDLGVDTAPRLEVLEVTEPPTRAAGIKVRPRSLFFCRVSRVVHASLCAACTHASPHQVDDVASLFDKLKNEAKVV